MTIRSQREHTLKTFDSSESQSSIKFPIDSYDESYEQTLMEESLESVLIGTSHLTNIYDLLEEFGVLIASRGKGSTFAEQAVCEPELRAVELEAPEQSEQLDRNSVLFPKCVRIPRCGGCCGASHLLECIPTKISHKSIKRAHIKFKRSSDGRPVPQVSQQTIQIETHEECKCKCRVDASACHPLRHKYRPELCKCECLNINDRIECKSLANNRIWDPFECRCKCVRNKFCSTGLYFSHNTCSCVEDDYKRL